MPLSFGKHTAEYVIAQCSILILYPLQMWAAESVVYLAYNECIFPYYRRMGQLFVFGDFSDMISLRRSLSSSNYITDI